MHAIDKPHAKFAFNNQDKQNQPQVDELLTTKQLPAITGFSKSYFEKARGRDYGPPFLRIVGQGRQGKILYRRSTVEAWLRENECQPGGCAHG